MATEGNLRVIAGAGSGKTKLLVSRYAYLVKEYGIDPANILCVTFTNKAAGEMKRRIRSLIGQEYDTSLICTYHGFCVRVLREDIEKIFYPKEFQIIDNSQQKAILGDIYQKFELKLDHASFEKIIKQIAAFKSKHRDYVAKMCCTEHCQIVPEIVTIDDQILEEFLQKQKQIYAMDFHDLLYFALDIFNRCPDVLEKWQDRLNYIQVDEFQDSSCTEMELVDRLSGKHGNLMIVGDPDQNIYEWRGSDVKLLVDFDKSHVPTKTVILNQNYRSTPQILHCANTLIEKNVFRLKKDLFTKSGDGAPVYHYHEKNEYAEADRIILEINQIRRETKCNFADFTYNDYGTDKKLHPRRDREYVVNPYQMAATNGRYYLICNCDGKPNIANFRLDRITKIHLLDTPAKPKEEVKEGKQFSLPKHMAEHLYMFSGESVPVTFRMKKKKVLNDAIDWFGTDITFTDETEDEVTAHVTVNWSAMRYWAQQYCRFVRVLTPTDLAERIKEDLREALGAYDAQ